MLRPSSLRCPDDGAPTVSRPVRSLLVADDDLDFRESLGELLAEEGWNVELAKDGTEAVFMALREGASYDALLLDQRMPGLTGSEVYSRVRVQCPVPAILMSAAVDVQELAERHGFFRFIRKPLHLDQLIGLLDQLVPRTP